MAKCRDCGDEVKFLARRCKPCQTKFEDALVAERAQAALDAEQQAKIQGRHQEEMALEQYEQSFTNVFDKFENRKEIRSVNFKTNGAEFQVGCVASGTDETYWLICVHKGEDWFWLSNNRTILLFEDGFRFVQDHDVLKDTNVTTNWADQVICIEEHHVDISDTIPKFVEIYDKAVAEGSLAGVDIKIGAGNYNLAMDFVRAVKAVANLASR
jgi:hypothetical protein